MSMQRQNSPYFSRRRVSSAGTDDGVTTNSDVHFVEDEALSHATKCLIRTCTIAIWNWVRTRTRKENLTGCQCTRTDWEHTRSHHVQILNTHLEWNFRHVLQRRISQVMCSLRCPCLHVLPHLRTTRSSIWEMMDWILVNDRLNEFNDAVVRIADEMEVLLEIMALKPDFDRSNFFKPYFKLCRNTDRSQREKDLSGWR